MPWQRLQDLLDAPPPPKNKRPANFSEAFRQEFLNAPQILADLIKNLWWDPREGEVRKPDGTLITGAEFEDWKAGKNKHLERLLTEHFLTRPDLFKEVQERLKPGFRGYRRLGTDVYLALRRSGFKDITRGLFREAVECECRRLAVPMPTHFRRDILQPCGLGDMGKARPGPKLKKRKMN